MTAATIVVTIGEPAGIGPDLAVRLAERTWPARLVLAGDCELLRERARRLGAGVRLVPYLRGRAATPGAIEVAHFPVAVPVQAGRLDAANARTVIASLDAALAGCLSGEFARDGHRAGAKERHQRCRRRLSPATPNTWPSAPARRAWS